MSATAGGAQFDDFEILKGRVDAHFSNESHETSHTRALIIQAATCLIDDLDPTTVEIEGAKYRVSNGAANHGYDDLSEAQIGFLEMHLGKDGVHPGTPIRVYEEILTKKRRAGDTTRNFLVAYEGIPQTPIITISNPPGTISDKVLKGHSLLEDNIDDPRELQQVKGILDAVTAKSKFEIRQAQSRRRKTRNKFVGLGLGLLAASGIGIGGYRYSPDSVSRAWDDEAAQRYETEQAAKSEAEAIAAEAERAAEEVAAELAAQQAQEQALLEYADELRAIEAFDALGLTIESEAAPIDQTFIIQSTNDFEIHDVPTLDLKPDSETAPIVLEKINQPQMVRRLESSQSLDVAETRTFDLPEFDPSTETIHLAHDGGAGITIVARVVVDDSGHTQLRTYMLTQSDSESLLQGGFTAATNETPHESIYIQVIPRAVNSSS